MKNLSIVVRAYWDDEAQVWVATTSDIDGLAVEAESVKLARQGVGCSSALIELNGETSTLPEISVHIVAEQTSRIPNPAF